MSKPSIIVFSKDRPMQLHAYLESLLYYSDAEQKDITVLYKESPGIDYTRVMKEYPSLGWVVENKFYDDLFRIIEQSGDHVVFGCDDVLFKNTFNLECAQNVLSQNEQIFGFSFRLGTNIRPCPKNISIDKNYIEWNWKDATEAHYNYPWELDCTLYRKSDILGLLQSTSEAIKSPNYLEGVFASNPKLYISRPNLACLNKPSQAIVITVNRVQDTHCNPIDDSRQTDIYTLNKIYNEQNNKLDIKAIAKIKNCVIHVGSEHFVLENKEKNWEKAKIRKPNPLKTFFKNINYLFRYNIKEMAKGRSSKYITMDELNLFYDSMRYGLVNDLQNLRYPNIKSPEETIEHLIDKKPSFCRFGDGELALIEGNSISFQRRNEKLALRLQEILQSDDKNIVIGVPYVYYASTKNMYGFVRHFMQISAHPLRKQITDLCIADKQYFDTGCTQMYVTYKDYDFKSYFEKIKEIWLNRDITIICGETIFDNIEHNIFDCAKSIEYLYAPSKNAFDEYDKILAQASKVDTNKVLIIILGPTATVLAYDLAKKGYQALDFGHIAKDYDAYRKNIEHTDETIKCFFRPD